MDLMSEEGIRALASAMPRIKKNPQDLDARGDGLYGAWLCGMVLGNVGMSLHHKLCHTLGGSFNLPHAEVHTVVLPHAIAFNAGSASTAMHRIERALNCSSGASTGLYDLAKSCETPLSLKDIGMKESDLDRAAEIAVSNPYWNPRPIDKDSFVLVRELLQNAFDGKRPTDSVA